MTTDAYEHWRTKPTYARACGRVKMPPAVREAAETTSCFSHGYHDETGTCDQLACPIRSYCQQAWQLAQVARGEDARNATATEAYTQDLDAKPKRRLLKETRPVQRGRFRGTDKYRRNGYLCGARPIDAACALFLQGLGDPPTLPGVWTAAAAVTEPVAVKQAANYHSAIIHGVVVARLWTDTSRSIKVDVVPELVAPLRALSVELAVAPIPRGSLAKCRPCTHRATFRKPEIAGLVGAAVLKRMRPTV
jgi:hypothetical protein